MKDITTLCNKTITNLSAEMENTEQILTPLSKFQELQNNKFQSKQQGSLLKAT